MIDSTGTENSCNTMTMSGRDGLEVCNDLPGSKVRLDLTSLGSTSFKIGKIGIFGILCANTPTTITSETFLTTTFTVDLTTQEGLSIPLPVIEIDPEDCYTVQYTIIRQVGNVDLEA